MSPFSASRRAILTVLALAVLAAAFASLALPSSARFHLGSAYDAVRGAFFPLLALGAVLTAAVSTRPRWPAVSGAAAILLTMAIGFSLEKLLGTSVGNASWVFGLASIAVILPLSAVVTAVGGLLSLSRIVRAHPTVKPAVMTAGLLVLLTFGAATFFLTRGADLPALLARASDPRGDDRLQSIHLLQEVDDPRIVPPLTAILENRAEPSFIRSAAAMALAGITRDPRAVEPLLRTVEDPNGDVRQTVTLALGTLARDLDDGPRTAAFDGLLRASRDADPMVRASAVQAIGWVEDPRAMERLLAALNDDPLVGFHARENLIRLTGQDFGYDSNAWRAWAAGKAGSTPASDK